MALPRSGDRRTEAESVAKRRPGALAHIAAAGGLAWIAACGASPGTAACPREQVSAAPPTASPSTSSASAGAAWPEAVSGPCDPWIAASVASTYRGMLRIEGAERTTLAGGPWPPARYCLVRVVPTVTGRLQLGYRFERLRSGQSTPEVVEREVAVDVLGSHAARTIFLDFPYRLPIDLGDSVEIPIPLDDPWGALQNLAWLPGEQSLAADCGFTPDPCQPAGEPPSRADWAPQLRLQSVGCRQVLLANLQTRTEPWHLYRAEAPGPVNGARLEVVPTSERIVLRIRSWQERAHGSSSSSMTQVDPNAVVMLRPGDVVWMRPR